MKRVVTACLAALLSLVLLAGCTGTTQVGYAANFVRDDDGGYWQGSYSLFTGNEEQRFRIDGEGEHIFTVSTTTEKGELSLTVTGPDDDEAVPYTGGPLAEGSFTFTVPGPGWYTLLLEAKNHKGSFDISWVHEAMPEPLAVL